MLQCSDSRWHVRPIFRVLRLRVLDLAAMKDAELLLDFAWRATSSLAPLYVAIPGIHSIQVCMDNAWKSKGNAAVCRLGTRNGS
jgi:hypothetical protein